VTTLARVLAYLLGLAVLSLVVILALAGVTAAVALVVTAVVMVALIAMGSLMGGRRRPTTAPAPWPPVPADSSEPSSAGDSGAVAGEGMDGGTMDG